MCATVNATMPSSDRGLNTVGTAVTDLPTVFPTGANWNIGNRLGSRRYFLVQIGFLGFTVCVYSVLHVSQNSVGGQDGRTQMHECRPRVCKVQGAHTRSPILFERRLFTRACAEATADATHGQFCPSRQVAHEGRITAKQRTRR